MGTSENFRSARLQESALILFWATIAIVCLTLFFKNEYQLSFVHEELVIGKIEQLNEQARVKNPSSLSWFQARPGLSLHHLDQIYTHSGSKMELELFDSGKLTVYENTLLRLTQADGKTSIDLGQGLVTTQLSRVGQGGRALMFTLNGKVYELSSEQAEIQIMNDQQSANIQVLTGTVELRSDSQTLTIQSDQQIQIHSDQMSAQELLEVSTMAPFQDQVFYTQLQKQIEFKWQSNQELWLHVARDPTFRRTIVKEQAYSVPLSPGVYYWRLEDNEGAQTSQVQRFEVKKELPPKWTSPTHLSTSIRLDRLQNNLKQLPLSWEAEGSRFRLQVGLMNDQNGVEWFIDETIERSVYELSIDKRGEYIARVKVDQNGRDEAIWSHDIFFRVWSSELRSPHRLIPRDRSKFIIFEEHGIQKVAWRPVAGIEKYEVRWIRPDGQERAHVVNDTHFDLPLSSAGPYQWQVRSLDGQESSSFSKIQQFEILKENFDPSVPENGLFIELDRPDQKVKFEWARVQKVKHYTFEMSPDPHFDQLSYVQAVGLPRIEISMPATGTYYWRTKVLTADGQEFYSRPFRVTVEPSAPPRRPRMRGRLKIEYLRSEVAPSFWRSLTDLFIATAHASDRPDQQSLVIKISWPEPSEQVKGYMMRIVQQGHSPVVELQLDQPFYIWEEAFAGEFFWEIAYIDFWDRVGPYSEPESFVIEEQNQQKEVRFSDIQKLELVRPKHGQKISPEAQILFQWRVTPNHVQIDHYLFELAQDLAFHRLVVSQEIAAQTRSFIWNRPDDLPGPFFWRVTAVQGETKTKSLRRRLDDSLTAKDEHSEILSEGAAAQATSLALYAQISQVDLKENEIQVDGTSLMGLRLDARHRRFKFSLDNNGGKVFDDQSFRRTSLAGHYLFSSLKEGMKYAVGVKLLRLSAFEVNSTQDKIVESAQNDFAGSLQFGHRWKRAELTAGLSFGGFFEWNVEAFWHGRWLSVGGGVESFSVGSDKDYFATKLMLGHQWTFE